MLIFFTVCCWIFCFQRMHHSNFTEVTLLLEKIYYTRMRIHHIVQALNHLTQIILNPRRKDTEQVLIGRNRINFVKSAPMMNLWKFLKTKFSIFHKRFNRITIKKITLIKQNFRSIKVMQCNKWQDMMFRTFSKHTVIKIYSFLIHFTTSIRKNPTPSNRQAQTIDAKLLTQLNIF